MESFLHTNKKKEDIMKTNVKYLVSIIVFAILLQAGVRAQIFTGGVEGEMVTSSVKISDISNSAVNAINGKGIMGYEAGLFLKFSIPATPFYLKPKFLIDHQSGSVTVSYPENSTDVDLNVTRLDIPVLAGLKIIGPLSIEAGPVYNRILTATNNFNGSSIDVRPGGLGYRVGANAQLGILGLNTAYQGVKNNSSGSTSLSSFDTPDELIFGASLSFGK
jgi:hypothetical protein